MSKREEERKKALAALSRIAYSSATPAAAPSSARATPPARPAPPARSAKAPARPAPKPAPAYAPSAEHKRKAQAVERKEKLDEARALRQRRANELARGSNLQWRGMDTMGVPASIRRTGFDRQEASTSQKIQDVLGDTKEKAGRAKAREKGKRAGGKR